MTIQPNSLDSDPFLESLAPRRNGPPVHKRYLSNRPRRYEAYIQAAKTYTFKLENDKYLYIKPFDLGPGNPTYYHEVYQVLNLLRAMDVTPRGRIVEVGSGSGWVTEILLGLGFEVEALEPSEDMIRVARDRIASHTRHPFLDLSRVRFYPLSLEECPLPDGCADAVLFHESLHHVIDEDRGLGQCFRVLQPGGVVGVSGDSNWIPGCRGQEDFWEEVMARFGALENPYTWEYLHYLLDKHGFVGIERYHGVNGLFPVNNEHMTIKDVVQSPTDSRNNRYAADHYNNVIARKPGHGATTTANFRALTLGEVHLIDLGHDKNTRRARLQVKLANRGETTWLHPAPDARSGYVTLALAQKDPRHREALNRCPLPRRLPPGEELVMEAMFDLPEGYQERPWYLDLVNESMFWFSSRGMATVEVRFH